MIGVDEALQHILERVTPLPAYDADLLDALGLTVAQPVISTINIPPFRNAAMDGYAVRAADIVSASPADPVALTVVADIAAGHPSTVVVGPGEAARIMTGAPAPDGADTVVRFEDTDERGTRQERGRVRILAATPLGANVRLPGEDVAAGQEVMPPGTLLGAAEIGVLASLGQARVRVHRRPRVAILATGDEIVDIGEHPGPGQIRDSNSYTLAALVRRFGGEPVLLGIARDRLDEVRRAMRLERTCDLFLSTAGVSVGEYDVVKQALQAEGQIDLWQVNMKPGRPLAFGFLGQTPYLGLPGNPVAAMVSFELFARPLLLRLRGQRDVARPLLRARTLDRLDNGSARRHFVRVRVDVVAGGEMVARMAGNQGSGVLTSMMEANALAIVGEGITAIPAGACVDVLMLHWD
jgi:molybdopterin molybdotransferase